MTSFAEENLSYTCTCFLLDRSTLALASSTTPVNSVVGSPHMSDRGRLPPSLGHDHTDAGGNVSLTGNRYGHYLSFFAEAFCKRFTFLHLLLIDALWMHRTYLLVSLKETSKTTFNNDQQGKKVLVKTGF